MGLKFLKDKRTAVLFFILFIVGIVISILVNSCLGCYDTKLGYPNVFYTIKGWPETEIGKTSFSILDFFIDIIFWYSLSFLIIWFYDRVKKK